MTLKKLLFVSAMSGVFASAGCQAQNPEESAKQAADAARGEVQDAAATARVAVEEARTAAQAAVETATRNAER